MSVLSYTMKEDHLQLECSKGSMMIIPYKSSIIRVRYTLDKQFCEKESLMVEQNKQQHISFSADETDQLIIFSTDEMQVHINKETVAFTYTDASGKNLAKEPERGGKTFVPVEVEKTIFDDNTEIENTHNADGIRAKATSEKRVVDRIAYQTKLEFDWADDEALYGLGSHESLI